MAKAKTPRLKKREPATKVIPRTITLVARVSRPEYEDFVSVVAMVLTLDGLLHLRKMIATAKALSEQVGHFRCFSYYDYGFSAGSRFSTETFPADEARRSKLEELDNDIDDASWHVLDDPDFEWPPECQARLESEVANVNVTDVFWTFYPKHTSNECSTPYMSAENVEEFIKTLTGR